MKLWMNINAYEIVIFYLFYAFILILLGIKREIQLRRRSKINYQKFDKKKKAFEFELKKGYLLFVTLFLISTSIFSYMIINNPVYNMYTIILGLLDIIVFLFSYLHISSLKHNKDLSLYQNYHKIIKANFKNKDLLAKQILQLRTKHHSLISECEAIENDFKGYVMEYTKQNALYESLQPLEHLINLYQKQIDAFDNRITTKFNEALKTYLTKSEKVEIQLDEIKLIEQQNLTDVLVTGINTRKAVLYDYALKELQNHHVIAIEQLNQMIEKLTDLKITLPNEFMFETLNYANKQTDPKINLLHLLLNKNLMTLDLLMECVNKQDMDWVYEFPIQKWIKMEETFTFIYSLIDTNASKSTFKIIPTLDQTYNKIIKSAFTEAKVDNEARKMISLYLDIMSLDNNYNDLSTKYENMAVVLYEYYQMNQANIDGDKIVKIINQESFESDRDYIEKMYRKLKEAHQALFSNTYQTILLYSKSRCRQNADISYDKVLKLYAEYRKNINIRDLVILDIFLKGFILSNENDHQTIETLLQMISMDEHYQNPLTREDLRYEKRKLLGRINFNYLTNQQNMMSFKRVLNRIEQKRLVLNQVVNY